MNNKTSPPSTNTTKKCRELFPYFPSLESRLAGEYTAQVSDTISVHADYEHEYKRR
jgi:hypothetical protein